MVISRQIGRAMAAQVERVNALSAEDVSRQYEAALIQIEELNDIVDQLRQRLERFEGVSEPIPSRGYVETRDGRFLDGKKVYSIYEAANLCRPRVSYDIAYRYIREGYWTAEQNPENRVWYVHATNSFVKRPHKKPQRGYRTFKD